MKAKKSKKTVKKVVRDTQKSWYANWHDHPYHGHVHWTVFLVVLLVAFMWFRSFASAVSDIVNPTVAITFPTDKTVIKPNTALTAVAQSSDDVGISSVVIKVMRWNNINGNSGTVTLIKQCEDFDAPYTCDWTVPSERNIEYMVQSVAYDTSGNFTISKYVQFPVR